jgi:hypothetical protein
MGMPVGVSKSSYETVTKTEYIKVPTSNPDPSNYKIIRYLEDINYLIVMVQYPDCTNYEGKKILVYKNCTIKNLLKQKSIDPHFSENKEYYSPFARFEPTEKGWKLARKLITTIMREV